MNYIILNDVISTSVSGLLIQSLPPVSKPLIRTQVDTVDGRDGDIITKLGYSAYDKEFSIGLHRHFDIDTIIEYFNSSGTVIFSNEPDKYYNYEIIEQIDFERLLRFRTATVKMHMQPFKYSAVAKEITKTYTTSAEKIFTVHNLGNIESKPKITIMGSGTINLYLNGAQIFVIQLADYAYISIDAAQMEAYQGNTLLNRLVTGDYGKLALRAGKNEITWTGTISEMTIENASRWI